MSTLRLLTILILSLSLAVAAAEESTATEFDLGTLTLSSLKLLGDAHLDANGSVRLTRDVTVPYSGAGRVLYSKPVRLRSSTAAKSPASFKTFFSLSIVNLNPSSIGAGIAFVIAPDSSSIGLAGGSLGLAGESSSSFVAVEFDTLMDVEFGDINSNHVGLDLNTVVSTEVGDLETIGIDLKSGDLVNAWIDYDGANRIINVTVSYSNLKPKEPILSAPLDLSAYVSEFAFVGFSGATQGSTEVHTIQWWSFSSSNPDLDSTADLEPPPPSTSSLVNSAANRPPSPNSPEPISPSPAMKVERSSPSTWQGSGAVAGFTTGGVFFAALFAGGLIWLHSAKKKNKNKKIKTSKPSPLTFPGETLKSPREFSYKEIRKATCHFNQSRVIGHGAFGTVYKGIVPSSGELIAVKRCTNNNRANQSNHNKQTEFLSELSIIGSLRHRNLVRLQGWCHEKDEILLVYELMPNGSLDKALFESLVILPWIHRKKILAGVASALAYLHQECENLVVHRDVKSSNIMLDEGFNARLGDFGLAREIQRDRSPDATVAAGTMGYLAPEYLLTGRASDKTDVFSFGAVVLEVASGRRPIERDNSRAGSNQTCNLVDWVWGLHRDGRLTTAADVRLGKDFEETEMRRVLLVGLACSNPDPTARPNMRTVVQILAGEAEVPVVPPARPLTNFSTAHLLMSLQDSVSMITMSTSSSEFDAGDDNIV